MRHILVVAFLLAAVVQVRAADIALVLNDAERSALVSALGASLIAQPQNSKIVTYLLNRIDTAPVVTGQRELPKDEKPEEKKPAEAPKDKPADVPKEGQP